MMSTELVDYVIVNNIPKTYRAADLRNFFSQFIETSGFSLFHFRHRPEIQQPRANEGNSHVSDVSKCKLSRCVTTCCVVRVYKERVNELFEMYNRKHWVDRTSQTLATRCFIKRINISDETASESVNGPKILKAGQKSLPILAERVKFTRSDLINMIEMHPPVLMPHGNVGTPTKYFLEQIQACRLPPSIITRLALEFPKSRGRRLYGSVAFDYGGIKWRSASDSKNVDFVRTSKGDIISEMCSTPVTQMKSGFDNESSPCNSEKETEEEEEDGSSVEEWERHESLHNDVTQQERLKERLFEEPIELQWEKGGSGLVFYTDAEFWDAKEGDFDEKTADDWDIDTSGYYEKGAGDKDARDLLQMRLEGRLRSGTAVGSDDEGYNSFGAFERHTKGFGRKVLEAHGWKQGEGIGNTVIGMSEPILDVGQHPRDKKGLGYRGEKLHHAVSERRKRRRAPNEEDRIFISTIYDNPAVTDPPESLLRSSLLTKLKYRTEFLKEKL